MTHSRVLALGVFDLFHVGHLRYLQYARARGECLSVAVFSDAMTTQHKGKTPIIPEAQRIELLRGLGWVDRVDLLPTPTAETLAAARWIAEWGVDHVVVGGGWLDSSRWQRLAPVLAARGISVESAPYTTGISSSELIAQIRQRTSAA